MIMENSTLFSLKKDGPFTERIMCYFYIITPLDDGPPSYCHAKIGKMTELPG